MNNEAMDAYHDAIRALYLEAAREAERLKEARTDDFAKGLAIGQAAAYANALSTFWSTVKDHKGKAG